MMAWNTELDSLLRREFQTESAANAALEFFKTVDPAELRDAMEVVAHDPGPIATIKADAFRKRRDHRRLTPKLDKDNPILQ